MPVAPPGASTASQYMVPAVTAVGVIVTVFQTPGAGFTIVLCASRVPGVPFAVVVYSPTTTFDAVFDASRYTASFVTVPPATALYGKASACPVALVSVAGAIWLLPTSTRLVLGVIVGDAVAVGLGEGLAVDVGVAVAVGASVPVGDGVTVGKGDTVAVPLAVGLAVGVGVGAGAAPPGSGASTS